MSARKRDRQLEKTLELLEASGQSAQALVRAIGSPRNAVTEWKAGRSKSYRKYAPQIAEFFGVPLEQLTSDD